MSTLSLKKVLDFLFLLSFFFAKFFLGSFFSLMALYVNNLQKTIIKNKKERRLIKTMRLQIKLKKCIGGLRTEGKLIIKFVLLFYTQLTKSQKKYKLNIKYIISCLFHSV